ncbi:hypothetical protein Ancab_015258 [Ancistrocladus abbreviatus]
MSYGLNEVLCVFAFSVLPFKPGEEICVRFKKAHKNWTRSGDLLRQSSGLVVGDSSDGYLEPDCDVIEDHKWKCVCTINGRSSRVDMEPETSPTKSAPIPSGIRIFEDVADTKVSISSMFVIAFSSAFYFIDCLCRQEGRLFKKQVEDWQKNNI